MLNVELYNINSRGAIVGNVCRLSDKEYSNCGRPSSQTPFTFGSAGL